MKFNEDTVKAIGITGGLVLIGYVLFKIASVGASAKQSVEETLSSIGNAVGSATRKVSNIVTGGPSLASLPSGTGYPDAGPIQRASNKFIIPVRESWRDAFNLPTIMPPVNAPPGFPQNEPEMNAGRIVEMPQTYSPDAGGSTGNVDAAKVADLGQISDIVAP